MPTIKRRTNIALGAVAVPLAGSQYEFLPFDALVQVAILADTGDEVEATMFSGTDVLLENATIDERALAEPIIFPDDYSIQDIAAQGERLGLTLRNTGAAAADVRTVVRVTPL